MFTPDDYRSSARDCLIVEVWPQQRSEGGLLGKPLLSLAQPKNQRGLPPDAAFVN
jgi:hypothetical protein